MKKLAVAAALATAFLSGTAAQATELEVTHWWTSGGEAAAVAEFAKAFDASGHTWVDGAIAGSSGVARPIIISRVLGGNPPGATQFNPGTDADDLVGAGLMTDLTDLAEAENWAGIINPSSQLESCTYDGRVFCVPVGLHSAQWLWINRHIYEDAGMDVPADWNEFIASSPALIEKGITPLSVANGWAISLLLNNIAIAVGGVDLKIDIYKNRNVEAAAGDEWRKVFEAMDAARQIVDPATIHPQWNEAVGAVINGSAAANVMGDWAGGEFAVANWVAGEDYDCLPGMGLAPALDTGGDVFFFPKIDDPEIQAAQLDLASLLFSQQVQVDFNLKKGSLPIRADIDMSAANDCMQKGLAIVSSGGAFPSESQMIDRDSINQIEDIYNDFFADHSVTVEEAQADFVQVIANAPPLQFD